MKCRESKRFLVLFLDGQLSQEQSLEIKAHLEKCQDCSKEAVFLKESWDLLRQHEPVTPSSNFKADFWKRLAKEELAFKKIAFSNNFKVRFSVVSRHIYTFLYHEKKKAFVFPRLTPLAARSCGVAVQRADFAIAKSGLKPFLMPVFTAAAVILICGTYVMNFISDRGIRNLAMSISDKDISMLKDFDLTEDLDVIENISILEELKVIDSVEL